jgi:hypothetical protein
MNLPDYKSYIEKLCVMSNNYYMYDDEYIKNKYNINSYENFRKFFKKNHSDKLIFNSEKSEGFFIKIMNLDSDYMAYKYGNLQAQTIVNFFVQKNNYNFNECDEVSEIKKNKTHKNNCNCKIKVKSVVNLSINALIFILIENNFGKKQFDNKLDIYPSHEDNLEISNCNLKITKLYNTESNKKIINSIQKIESIKKSLGITKDNIKYLLTDTMPEVENLNIKNTNQNINQNIIEIVKEESSQLVENQINNLLDNTNIKKINEQLISESLNLDDENGSSYYKKKIFKKPLNNTKIESTTPEQSELSNRFNNLQEYAQQNVVTNSNHFNLDNLKSTSSDSENIQPLNTPNRFGNVIIKENKIKIEKTQPIDLKNSSDILVSYNEHDSKKITNNFLPVKENKNNTNNEENSNENSITKSSSDSSSDSSSESSGESNVKDSSTDDKQNLTSVNIIPDTKREVIEILNYLDVNFNYITSDDILIDKDKKMQICTFMVEIKYKIFGMFRQLEKSKTINQQYKSRITNNYEKIYYYVVKSNKIGSTGEMVEFKNNKELLQYIIEDINQI